MREISRAELTWPEAQELCANMENGDDLLAELRANPSYAIQIGDTVYAVEREKE
jgi:hypothetical protein